MDEKHRLAASGQLPFRRSRIEIKAEAPQAELTPEFDQLVKDRGMVSEFSPYEFRIEKEKFPKNADFGAKSYNFLPHLAPKSAFLDGDTLGQRLLSREKNPI